MRISVRFPLLCVTLSAATLIALVAPSWAGVPIGTAFTYQGSLHDGGLPPTAAYDFRFTMYDAASDGNTVSGSLELGDVSVVGGLFTVELDFGVVPFSNAEAKWLLVEVRPGASTGAYTALPRQKLNPTPNAIGLSLPLSQTVGTIYPVVQLANTGTGSGAIIQAGSGTDLNYGVQGITWSTAFQAAGLRGWAAAGTGTTIGVEGVSQSPDGTGLVGTGPATGAYITGTGPNATGVYARGALRGLYAENLGTGPAVVATGAGANAANATIQAANTGVGPAINLTAQGGSASNATMRVDNTNASNGMAAFITNSSTFATAHLRNGGSGQILWLEDTGASGDYIVATGPSGHKFWVDGAGVTHTKVLEILGGADLSERFDVSEAEDGPEPGTVVSIDPDREGRLEVSRTPYDRRVAGIISGAGGVKTGMLMGQEGSVAHGAHPVALTGRVYCRATAANGPIRPGDLLTTSSVAGHAMRADDPSRAQGAILGKAMGSLERGEGLVLVLVGLQ